MSVTPGELLFYGGIVGMALTVIAAIVVIIILSGSRKRIRDQLNEEYGVNVK